MKTLLLAGTKKGLFAFTGTDRKKWKLAGPFHRGKEINHAVFDQRTGRIFATANDSWFGSQIVSTPNFGQKWDAAKHNPAFGKKSDAKLDRIWHIAPGLARDKNVLYAGVAPAALFRSDDGGKTWEENKALSAHPTRKHWHPGGGGLCLHSIVTDPSNPARMFVGISAVGVFRTEDGGKSWHVANRGTRADFLPNKMPEYGQCVHKLLLSDGGRSVLFQQNHCGVYRSGDAGRTWQEVTKGLPSDFGFPLAIHPHDRETIYVIPLQGGEFRCPPAGSLRVYRSTNGGKKWEALTKGLPQHEAFCGIYREGMATDSHKAAGIYFGTNTGKIFASRNDGDSWAVLADNLPPVTSVSVAEL